MATRYKYTRCCVDWIFYFLQVIPFSNMTESSPITTSATTIPFIVVQSRDTLRKRKKRLSTLVPSMPYELFISAITLPTFSTTCYGSPLTLGARSTHTPSVIPSSIKTTPFITTPTPSTRRSVRETG